METPGSSVAPCWSPDTAIKQQILIIDAPWQPPRHERWKPAAAAIQTAGQIVAAPVAVPAAPVVPMHADCDRANVISTASKVNQGAKVAESLDDVDKRRTVKCYSGAHAAASPSCPPGPPHSIAPGNSAGQQCRVSTQQNSSPNGNLPLRLRLKAGSDALAHPAAEIAAHQQPVLANSGPFQHHHHLPEQVAIDTAHHEDAGPSAKLNSVSTDVEAGNVATRRDKPSTHNISADRLAVGSAAAEQGAAAVASNKANTAAVPQYAPHYVPRYVTIGGRGVRVPPSWCTRLSLPKDLMNDLPKQLPPSVMLQVYISGMCAGACSIAGKAWGWAHHAIMQSCNADGAGILSMVSRCPSDSSLLLLLTPTHALHHLAMSTRWHAPCRATSQITEAHSQLPLQEWA